MLSSSLGYIIIRSFPECICLILSSFILLGIDLNLGEILKKSIVFVIIVFGIRLLPISFGIHTILILFILGIILYKFKNQNIISTIFTTAETCMCLAMSEGIYMIIATNIFKIPVDIITDNTKITSAILSLPSLGIFVLLVILLKSIQERYKNNKKSY